MNTAKNTAKNKTRNKTKSNVMMVALGVAAAGSMSIGLSASSASAAPPEAAVSAPTLPTTGADMTLPLILAGVAVAGGAAPLVARRRGRRS